MKYGLTEENEQKIIEVFKKDKDIHRAIIFGPRATANFKKSSGINFALSGFNLAEDELPDLKDELDDIGLKVKFELLLLSSITDPDFLLYIQTTGKGFYKKA